MVRTVLYVVYFGIVLLLSQLFMILPYYLLRMIGLKQTSRIYMNVCARIMARLVIGGLGARVSIEGLEHVPHNAERVCIVSNHQGLFDIPLAVAYVPIVTGFIAKIELKKVPFLNFWLFAMDSVLLNRKSPHSAIKAINEGVKKIKAGRPFFIFPEGTRSRSDKMGKFKPGSLKLALRSHAVILPLTIQGSYKLFEEFGRIKTARVHLTIHPPVPTTGLDSDSQKKLAEHLQKIIGGPLTANNE